MDPIRVVIADHKHIARAGLCHILQQSSDIVVVGEVSRGEEVLQMVDAKNPDVLILEMRLPGLSGLEVLRCLQAADSSVHVLVFSVYDRQIISGIIAHDIFGYLTKDTDPEKIVEAIRGIGRGEAGWFTPRIAEILRKQSVQEKQLDMLSKREHDILMLIIQEYSNEEIAKQLNRSPLTVKNHVSSILNKLGVKTRAGAVVWACRQGLILSVDNETALDG